ncbi:hypothetical protein BO78DRAFT_374862 [Aspergillus sclerotiicarbonarius CBS 121057]|uniref:Zn(2)-C6 fungal-type domain-containing protein n=1 Tax=Aspergillus sclerotiicarbonarius (strain CBS 121057 / IBT 28362) TaxID=1448318 RepID=A0A319E0P4_ASPSB|nr:hypothetical protein BO78DRAFT_374862 [Aspergillus sclerotiicarbonarius CBS 121057]
MDPDHHHRRNTIHTRPYRSKRHPPCDDCRRKKLRCQADGHGGCQRCLAAGRPCSFARTSSNQPVGIRDVAVAHEAAVAHQSASLPSFDHTIPNSVEISPLPHTPFPFPERQAQTIQTLDALDGHAYQVIGSSGESDPWLLRHCKFNDRGFLLFHQVHFRNAGGVPLHDKIPVHFLVSADHLYESSKEGAGSLSSGCTREDLNRLVPLECGQRLVLLFLRFVFPALPIISRSQFDLAAAGTMPDQSTLQKTPVCLLAAIYASAQPFAKFDDYLCLLDAYSSPPTDLLWRIVLELVLRETHTPHLATLQAGILYLHRPVPMTESMVADSSFLWSFLGMLVGAATSLGLQLDCRVMGLPLWERRIRRRLWWAIYAEDKWRSLLMGRPSYIGKDEWDVADLEDDDFTLADSACAALQPLSTKFPPEGLCAQPFQHFTRLCCIADQVQQSLYTLRASQRLASDFHATLAIAGPILQQLKEWSVHLPALPTTDGSTSSPVRRLHLNCSLLEIFTFRALLRPMVRSATPPPLREETRETHGFTDQFTDLLAELFELDEIEPSLAIDMTDENGMGSAVLRTAESCADNMIRMVTEMGSGDLSGFWYSWSRIGFATLSNFALLLVVQAPTKDHALRAKARLDLWRHTLRNHSTGCRMMDLGLIRLDGPLWAGLASNYYLPRHVKDALDAS